MREPPDPPTLHVALDVEVGSEPIQGTIEDPAGRRPFVGWLDLIGSIEQWTFSSDRPTSSESPD